MKSVVLLGDSILAREHQDGVEALIPRIKSAFPGLSLKSYAKGGANSRQCVESMQRVIIPTRSLVFISLGMNDAAPWKQIPINEFIANYRQALARCRGSTIVLLTPYPVDTKKQEPPGRDNDLILEYAQSVKQLARETGATYIDAYEAVNEAMKTQDLHIADGVHLNNEGYSLLFQDLHPIARHWLG